MAKTIQSQDECYEAAPGHDHLTPRQLRAALMLAAGTKKKEVAEAVSVSPQTISEWLSDPEFERQVNREKYALLNSTRDRLRNLGLNAVDALEALLTQEDNPTARLKAVELTFKTQGILDPQTGLLGAGIGPTEAESGTLDDWLEQTPEYQDVLKMFAPHLAKG